MWLGRAIFLLCIPYVLSGLTLDQKVSLKLIESLWQEGLYSQAENEIDHFLSKYNDPACDESLSKMKADLLIKKKNYKEAIALLENLIEVSPFVQERKALCYYELHEWNKFLELFEKIPSHLDSPFGKKIWNLGTAQAIHAEQNLARKTELIEKTTVLFKEALEKNFNPVDALSLALIREENKDYAEAYKLYEKLYDETLDLSYQLSMARMASHTNPQKALELLEPLRWKSGSLGANAALFAMQILDTKQDFHKLFELSQEELKIAPEGYRKAKISLFHLKSLFYLKCFDKIPHFFSSYQPHRTLKGNDLQQAITLLSKAFLIKNEKERLEDFYKQVKNESLKEATLYTGRILAKMYLDQKDFLKGKDKLEELVKMDPSHQDEYFTVLGFCYLNTQAYEVAENYFIQVLKMEASPSLKKKAIQNMIELPTLTLSGQKVLLEFRKDLDLNNSPKALMWVVEALKNGNQPEAALETLNQFGDQKSSLFHQKMGELLEFKDKKKAIIHFEEALKTVKDEGAKAYLHQKLFIDYFDYDKNIAANHLFHSLYLKPFTIEESLFDGLLTHFFQKAFDGVKIFIHDDEARAASSKLLRLISYKPNLNEKEKVIHARTLRKLCRYEEALASLKGSSSFLSQMEKSKVLNHLGQYTECDALIENILEEKPYTLFLEGQLAFLNKILLEYDRVKASTDSSLSLEKISKDLRILSVCIQEKNSSLNFEVELLKRCLLSQNKQELMELQAHPFLETKESGNHRKVLNLLVNGTVGLDALSSMSGLLSDTLEWILIHNYGSGS